jgi:putative tricarboxylic transport membrane protein
LVAKSLLSGADMSDRVFAAVWLAVCGLIAYQMWVLVVPFTYEPVGPKAFPILLAALMALCCIALLIKPDSSTEWPNGASLIRGAILIGVLIAYAMAFDYLGFPLATVLMVFVVSRIFGGRPLNNVLTAVLTGVLGYIVFDRILEVSLPLGRVWG